MNRSNAIFNSSESQLYSSSGNLSQKFKLIFLGDQSVGKTSIINRFIFDTFDGKDHPTVGIDFISKTLYHDEKSVKLQLWDTAGQERFRSLIPNYIRDSAVALIVFDITNEITYNNLTKWIQDVRSERGHDIVLVIVGNKIDLEKKRVIQKEVAEEFAREHDTLYMEVSAKLGENINSLFQTIASVLPGNENRGFLTDNNFPMTSMMGLTPNINLTARNQEEEAEEVFEQKRNCQC
jgi:Ras-related protein Rab-6A